MLEYRWTKCIVLKGDYVGEKKILLQKLCLLYFCTDLSNTPHNNTSFWTGTKSNYLKQRNITKELLGITQTWIPIIRLYLLELGVEAEILK